MVDLSKFIDNSLKSDFLAKPYDVTKDRTKLAARFTKALTQFPNSKAPNKIWKLSNGVVEVKVSLGSGLLTINGATTNYVPENHFKGFIAALVDAANGGEFDGALKAIQTAPQAPQETERAKRNTNPQSSLNIGVAGKRRGANPLSWADIKKHYLALGKDAGMIDKAIKQRQDAEKAAK